MMVIDHMVTMMMVIDHMMKTYVRQERDMIKCLSWFNSKFQVTQSKN